MITMVYITFIRKNHKKL